MLVACGDADGVDPADEVMTIRLPFDSRTLDPTQADNITSLMLAPFAYDTIVALRDGEIVPLLAEDWEVTPDSIELKIREGVTCSDGSELTMQDIADSIERMKDPTAGMRAVAFGPSTDFTVSSDEDSRTVGVQMERPWGGLLFGMSQVFVICRAGLDDPASLATESHGTGPYTLEGVSQGDEYRYTAREGYDWAPTELPDGAQAPAAVTFRVISEEATGTNAFLSGDLDITTAQGADKRRLAGSDVTTFEADASTGSIVFRLNHFEGRPTADQAVRRAILTAMDRRALTTVLYDEDVQVANTLQRSDGLCYSPEVSGASLPEPDVEAARSILVDAGYREEDGRMVGPDGEPLSVTLVMSTIFGTQIGDVVIDQLGAIGIDVKVVSTGDTSAVINQAGGDWDLYLSGFQDIAPTPLLGLADAPDATGPNFIGIEDAELNEMLLRASKVKLTEACDQWFAIESHLFEQASIIPLAEQTPYFFGSDTVFAINNFAGVYPDGLGWLQDGS